MRVPDRLGRAVVPPTDGAVQNVRTERKALALILNPRTSDAQRALGYNDWFKKLPEDLQHWWTVDVRYMQRFASSSFAYATMSTVPGTVEVLFQDDHQSGGQCRSGILV